MNDMNLIHGRNICAMVNDNTSVKEMLQMMGVDPTDEIEAMSTIEYEGDEELDAEMGGDDDCLN